MTTAKFLRDLSGQGKWRGTAALYELDRPIKATDDPKMAEAIERQGLTLPESRYVVASVVHQNELPCQAVFLTDAEGQALQHDNPSAFDVVINLEGYSDPQAPLRALGWIVDRSNDKSAN